MKKTTWFGWSGALALAALLCLPAQAGIIITEGKIADEQAASKEAQKDKTTSRRTLITEKTSEDEGEPAESADTCAELDDEGFCVQVESNVGDVGLKEVSDLSNDDPEGWDCTPVGGGVEVCEPAGPAGAAPGAGAGGGLGVDALGAEAGLAGCQGSEGAPSWVALLFMALALLRLRSSHRLDV